MSQILEHTEISNYFSALQPYKKHYAHLSLVPEARTHGQACFEVSRKTVNRLQDWFLRFPFFFPQKDARSTSTSTRNVEVRSVAIPWKVEASTDNNMENADRSEISPFRPASTSSASLTLENMPYDIIFQIFMKCRPDSQGCATSWPLKCKILQRLQAEPQRSCSPQRMRRGLPRPSPRSTMRPRLVQNPINFGRASQKEASWHGLSQYRFSRSGTSRFLNICIYGDGKIF